MQGLGGRGEGGKRYGGAWGGRGQEEGLMFGYREGLEEGKWRRE